MSHGLRSGHQESLTIVINRKVLLLLVMHPVNMVSTVHLRTFERVSVNLLNLLNLLRPGWAFFMIVLMVWARTDLQRYASPRT